jgi:hypothetical protein
MTARGLAPLRHRGFRFLVAGQLGSNVGDAFAGLSQRTWRNFGAITSTGARRPETAGRLSTASTHTDSAVHAS